MKKHLNKKERITKRFIKIFKIFSYFSIIFFINVRCSDITTKEKLITVKDNSTYSKEIEIIYESDSIIYICQKNTFNSIKDIDTTKLIRKNNNFVKHFILDKDFCNKRDFNIPILTLSDSIFNHFECINGRYDFYSYKLNENLYISVENIYGQISYYQCLIFYNENFRILRIDKQYADYKYSFIAKNFDLKIDCSLVKESPFIKRIANDSIDYVNGLIEPDI